MGRYAVAGALAVGLFALSACGDGSTREPDPSDASTSGGPAASESTDTPTPTSTREPSTPVGGPADAPTLAMAVTDLIDWRAVSGPVDRTVTVSGAWTLSVDEQGSRAVLDGPTEVTIPAGPRRRISDTLIDGQYALVVSQDRLEERPAVATVVELSSRHRLVLDGTSEVPTTTGGTWALGAGHVLHATSPDAGAVAPYCLASVDLASERSEVAWCAEPRHGFSNARITAEADTLLTFDDSQPSCRTVGSLDPDAVTPFPGVTPCAAWEGVVLAGGRTWSVVPNPRRIEAAHLYASIGDGYFDLGEGISGSLVACAGSAYFARDPGREGDPAQVLRWSPDGRLAVVYEAPAAQQAFVTVPLRCGGDSLTLTALTESGDEQVAAPLG